MNDCDDSTSNMHIIFYAIYFCNYHHHCYIISLSHSKSASAHTAMDVPLGWVVAQTNCCEKAGHLKLATVTLLIKGVQAP